MTRNPLITFIVILVFHSVASAQKVDYNAIILPADARGVEFSEKLVRLAWINNPSNSILENQVNVADLDMKLAKRNWLNQFNVTGNLNEFTLNPQAMPDVPLFFPRYNIGATITLGNFAYDPLKVRIRKEEKEIAIKSINSQKLAIRAEVLRKYQTYLTNQELYLVRAEALEAALASFSLAEQKFKSGEISIENYNAALENFNTHKTQKIIAEGNLMLAKIDLEELIGVRLEDVI
jgi:outer membrane protein TolC